MARSKKIALLFGCLFTLAALASWMFAQHKLREHRWTVLEGTIHIESGFLLEDSFTVDVPADYFVEIECSKTIEFERLDSLLTDQLAVSYSVTEDGKPLASGDSAGYRGAAYAQDYISRQVGKFPCAPGHTYHLTLRVTQTLPELASTDPVAKVSVAPIVFKSAFVTASLAAYLAIGLGIAGIICMMPPLCSMVFRRRPENDDKAEQGVDPNA